MTPSAVLRDLTSDTALSCLLEQLDLAAEHPDYTLTVTSRGLRVTASADSKAAFYEVARAIVNAEENGYAVYPRCDAGGAYCEVELVRLRDANFETSATPTGMRYPDDESPPRRTGAD